MTAVFEKILEMSLTAAWVIGVVLVIRLLLRKAPKKYSYALWAVAAFRLVCPVSFEAVFSIFRFARVVGGTEVTQAPPTPSFSYMSVPADDLVPAISVDPEYVHIYPVTTPIPVETPVPASALSAMDIAAILWCVGLAALAIYGVVSYVRLRRRMANAVRLEGNVYQSDRVRSPFILGFVRPNIYLPFGLSDEQQSYVLAHERYHIRRLDHIVRPAAFLILAVHWFNPLVWAAYYLMGRDMEMSCDEKVLGGGENIRKAYSLTLLSFAANRRFPSPSPLAFGETGVKGRIKNALNWKKPRLWVTIAAVVVCVVVVAACAANPKEPDAGSTAWEWMSTVTAEDVDWVEAQVHGEESANGLLNDQQIEVLVKKLNAVPQDALKEAGTPVWWLNLTICCDGQNSILRLSDDQMGLTYGGATWLVEDETLETVARGVAADTLGWELVYRPTKAEEARGGWQADLDHDGVDETVVVRATDVQNVYTLEVYDGGELLWSMELNWHGWDAYRPVVTYLLVEENGRDYLAEWSALENVRGVYSYGCRVFYLNGAGEEITWSEESRLFSVITDLDIDALRTFESWVNALLGSGQVIAKTPVGAVEGPETFYWVSPADKLAEQDDILARWAVDLTHDGQDEIITLRGADWHDTLEQWTQFTLTVTDASGAVLWTGEAGSSHVGWNGYYLYRQDGRYYLLNWVPYGSTGIFDLRYSVFSLTSDGVAQVLVENEVTYDVMVSSLMELDVAELYRFEAEVNALLANAEVLFANTDNGTVQYAVEAEPFSGYAAGAEEQQKALFASGDQILCAYSPSNERVQAMAEVYLEQILSDFAPQNKAMRVDSLEEIPTGCVGLTDGCFIYRVEYQLVSLEDKPVWQETERFYLVVYEDWSGSRRTYTELGMLTEKELQERYNRPELLEQYGGDIYLATAAEMLRDWQNGQ